MRELDTAFKISQIDKYLMESSANWATFKETNGFYSCDPRVNIAEMWEQEAYFEQIQYDNWIKRCAKRHLYEEGLSEHESKVVMGWENILFSELACLPIQEEEI
jgi:hypothetical protein